MIHVNEILAVAQLKLWDKPLHKPTNQTADMKRVYDLLKLTSRSFASVIEQLHPDLRDAVAIFYVVLRGLDTIEDDTTIDNKIKLPILENFRDVLKRKDWTFNDSKEKDAVVLREFDVILREYHNLRTEYVTIIADIADKMGKGMAEYIGIESQTNYNGVETIKDYDRYCHYVAGIVGEGLTRMALVPGYVTQHAASNDALFESMGLFLQKTNIIRDFREDLDDGRSFWPKEVWSKYTPELKNFADPKNSVDGVHCISNLVILSLNHVIDCLQYLASLRDESYFRFCAIPQIMSIATLELVFNNPDVFQKNVKIRRGTTAALIVRGRSMGDVYEIFREYIRKIHQRNKASDPNFFQIEILCAKIEQYIDANNNHCRQFVARKNPPGYYDDNMTSFLIVLSFIGSLVFTGGLMIYIGWLFGAEYPAFDLIKNEFQHFYDFFILDKVTPLAVTETVAEAVSEAAETLL